MWKKLHKPGGSSAGEVTQGRKDGCDMKSRVLEQHFLKNFVLPYPSLGGSSCVALCCLQRQRWGRALRRTASLDWCSLCCTEPK